MEGIMSVDTRRRSWNPLFMVAGIAAAGTASLAFPDIAAAYIGPSYLQVPGLAGGAKHPKYGGWVRAESNFWTTGALVPELRGARAAKNDLLFTEPPAPDRGPNTLSISVLKSSSAYRSLMDRCRSGKSLDAVTYAESAELARHPQEHGPRPQDVPDFFHYTLKNVTLECPVAEGASEQAFTLRFSEIQWANYRPHLEPRPITAQPARLVPAATSSGTSKVFALSWFAAAVDASRDQCPKMNSKPGDSDYYALLPKSKADAKRAELAGGGVGPKDMQFRGPGEINVALMPGVVPDPGHVAPIAKIVPGFDLDGSDGAGRPPKGSRAHENFTSPDGRRGIDNQLYTVEGCVEGFRRRGFLPMIFNESRAKGQPTAMVEISGIDNPQNDDDVIVTLFYSTDTMKQSPTKILLPDFTYRVTENPEFAQDFVRFKGKIVDGTVYTEVRDELHIHEMFGIETTFFKPRLMFQMTADGGMKGMIGGYLDWRQRLVWQIFRSSDYENTIGFQIPAIYHAMRRAADGLLDPATGDYNGISAAFEIEGISAFVPPSQQQALLAGDLALASERP
jgi:hypothetical protein